MTSGAFFCCMVEISTEKVIDVVLQRAASVLSGTHLRLEA